MKKCNEGKMFLKALLEEKKSRERKDVEGRRKKEEAKRLLEAGMRRMEGCRDWGEAAGVKGEEGRV
jgi:hypothetical protein